MFQSSPGFKALYQQMTLFVVLDFDCWKILVQGPGIIIDGGHQPDRSSAEEEAHIIADYYVRQEQRGVPSSFRQIDWKPLESNAFLRWQNQVQTAMTAANSW